MGGVAGIEVADVKGGVFCGNLTAMMQRANEFDQQMRRKQTHDDDDDDDDEEDPDPGVDGTVKTRGFRRFGMLDPGVVAGSTRGIGVSFFQSSSGTILSCRFLKCGETIGPHDRRGSCLRGLGLRLVLALSLVRVLLFACFGGVLWNRIWF